MGLEGNVVLVMCPAIGPPGRNLTGAEQEPMFRLQQREPSSASVETIRGKCLFRQVGDYVLLREKINDSSLMQPQPDDCSEPNLAGGSRP